MSEDALAKLSAATQALAEAKSLGEVKAIRDIALAAQTYARAAKLGLEAQNHAAEVKLRAERKAGELLAELERSPGERTDLEPHNSLLRGSEYSQLLEDNAIIPMTAHRWQVISAVPDDAFERHVVETTSAGQELTSAGVLRLAQLLQRERNIENFAAPGALPNGKYRVWYADPPWQYNDSGVLTENDNYGHAERHYPTMSIEELEELGQEVRERCTDNAVLFLWVTSPMLEDCFRVIRAWGFRYKTSFVWDKVRHNFGHYNSVRHELLLVCTCGSCTPDVLELFDSVQTVERTATHSAKPAEFRTIIDTLYPSGRRIEMFARAAAPGWDAWGNEPNVAS